LKKAILHRKNALFFKTRHGAAAGDLYLSLIHTCELNGANPFDYLTELQRHASQLAVAPGEWMPWNYRAMLEGSGNDQATSEENRRLDRECPEAAQGVGETEERRTD
jgi:hypothetical protein